MNGAAPAPQTPAVENAPATARSPEVPGPVEKPVDKTVEKNGHARANGLSEQDVRLLHMLQEPIAAELGEAERILREELRNPHPCVDELTSHSFRLGGKRLRPLLVLLTAKALGGVRREHLVIAAVVEMIHTATLLHDDVLDEAHVRRHLPTVNALWNNEASVLAGDYLFTHAFYLASTLESTYGCREIGRATNTVCEGELRQVHSRGNFHLSEREYLGIIEAKTAALCACCCQLGAHYAGAAPEVVSNLTRFGRDLGIAFQIADDLLDVTGDEAATGKSLGTDLEKQKLTLPGIRLRDTLPPAELEGLEALWNDLSLEAPTRQAHWRQWWSRSDALAYTRQRAQDFANSAREALAGLPDNRAAQTLRLLADFSVARRK